MPHRTTVCDEYDYQNRGAFGTVALQDLSRTRLLEKRPAGWAPPPFFGQQLRFRRQKAWFLPAAPAVPTESRGCRVGPSGPAWHLSLVNRAGQPAGSFSLNLGERGVDINRHWLRWRALSAPQHRHDRVARQPIVGAQQQRDNSGHFRGSH
jgi:hypothetical protein